MRIPLLLAVLGLIVVEGFLVPRAGKDFRTMRKMRTEMAPENGRPVSLGPFAGYDKDGRPLALTTNGTRWIVPLVLHSSRMDSDLDYLIRLRKALPSPALTLVGICDEILCQARLENVTTIPDLPILVYGSYAPLKDILRFDDQDQVLLMNQLWGVTKSLPRASSAEEMAASLKQVTVGQ